MAASGPWLEFGGSSLRQFLNLDWGFGGEGKNQARELDAW
jgi:hypothetical protein